MLMLRRGRASQRPTCRGAGGERAVQPAGGAREEQALPPWPWRQPAVPPLSRCIYNQEIAARGLMIAAAVDKTNQAKWTYLYVRRSCGAKLGGWGWVDGGGARDFFRKRSRKCCESLLEQRSGGRWSQSGTRGIAAGLQSGLRLNSCALSDSFFSSLSPLFFSLFSTPLFLFYFSPHLLLTGAPERS